MEVTPELHLWESREADNIGWHAAFAELIDNSLDAGATRVEISMSGKRLDIRDDGNGVAEMDSLVKLGRHKRHRTAGLGAYGIGLKDAWCFFGNRLHVESTHGARRGVLDIARSDIRVVDGRWIAPDPTYSPVTADTPRGTLVRFDPVNPRRGKPADQTLRKLGWTFMPALQSGRQIVVGVQGGKRCPIAPCSLPRLTERVEARFCVEGKPVELLAGIMADGERNPYPSLWFSYRHRNICYNIMGCGQYSAAKVAGLVKLGDGWKFTSHKNDIAELSEELDAALFAHMEPLLAQAADLIEDIASNELRSKIEVTVNEAIGKLAREKRHGPANDTGAILPKHTKIRRRTAAKSDPNAAGSVVLPGTAHRKRGIKIDWCQLDPDRIGEFQPEANAVLLNRENVFIAHCKRQSNAEALHAVAIGLVCHHAANNEGRQKLLVEQGDFIAGWGRVMASLVFEEKANGK